MEQRLGWFADPLFFGDYPKSLKAAAGGNLPAFSSAERALLAKSTDFLGLNFYTARWAAAGLAVAHLLHRLLITRQRRLTLLPPPQTGWMVRGDGGGPSW